MRRCVAIMLASAVAVTVPCLNARAQAPGDTIYASPGMRVSAGDGARLNLYCTGHGSPAVIFDSGWEDWAPSWAYVQPQVSEWTRACSYDRAGAGFSDPGPLPRTSARIAEELHAALHNAGIAGPYILVGHAFGGDNVRAFADLFMDDVAGLVLVEADPMDVAPKQMSDDDHSGQVGLISQLRQCRDLVASGLPLPLLAAPPGRPARTCAQQFFRGIPEVKWSAALNARVMQLAQTKVAMYDAYISEMEQTATDEAFLQSHRRSLGSRPIRVLTTGNHGVGSLESQRPVTPEHREYEHQIALAQARWLELSSDALQLFTERSSEYVQYDRPDAVVDAIRDVYGRSKSVGRSRPRLQRTP